VPRVSVNAIAPHCWNKDGHADSLLNFLDDPDFKIGRLPVQRHPTCSAAAPGLRVSQIAFRSGWKGVAERSIRLAICA
jgi:hypothetical protein